MTGGGFAVNDIRRHVRDLDAARSAGDKEAFLDYFKRLAIFNEQIEFMPHLADRWVDEVIADCRDAHDARDRLVAMIGARINLST